MFFQKKKPKISFDPALQEPAVRQSICTGEMTAGFIDRQTGAFHDVMRVDGPKGLRRFCEEIGVEPESVKTIY